MQIYTFDFICDSQDFNHNEEFVLKEDLDSEMESKQKEITALKDREKKLLELVLDLSKARPWIIETQSSSGVYWDIEKRNAMIEWLEKTKNVKVD